MGADLRSKVLLWLAAWGILALLAAPWILRWRQERLVRGIAAPREKLSTLLPPDTAVDSRPASAPELAPDSATGGSGPPEASPAPAVHPVDLTWLRERLPDNLYWSLGVPTKDPQRLREREEQARYWHGLNGKVLSNTATEAEIHEYYGHRRRVSEDFMAFATLVLEAYGERLTEPERGLYELSLRMHRTRLEELPRQIDEALARKQAQDERRAVWHRSPHP